MSAIPLQPQLQPLRIPTPEPEPASYVPKPLEKIHGWIKSRNIAAEFVNKDGEPDEYLSQLGAKVVREYDIDEESRSDWKAKAEIAMKIAMQVTEQKNYPWPNAANVKYPLITVACIQFAANAYPEIIKGNDVVKFRVRGQDPTGQKAQAGQIVADHMSWQLMEEMEEWEEETDKLLNVLPALGFVYRKTYFNPLLQRNVSELALPEKVVVHYKTKNLQTCRRITEILTYYKNDIREFVEAGLWIDPKIDSLINEVENSDDTDPPYTFLEQHRWEDLDGDGYQEPVIVTVHKDTMKVVRIVARFDEDGLITDGEKVIKIVPDEYYTKIPFIPASDGSFYDVGFGTLLQPINEVINTGTNQLLDAGTMANTNGGFISNQVQLGKKSGGTVSFRPNEWKQVIASGPLKDAFYPFPAREPSATLFQLLGMMVESGKEIASTQDVLQGKNIPANTPATTTLAQVERGLQMYSAIFKRIYRAFKQEFRKLYKLNLKYGKPETEFNWKDQNQTVKQQDYKNKGFDIVPVADPKMISDIQRMARAMATKEAVSGRPHVDEDAITGLLLDAINPEHKVQIMLPPDKWKPTLPQLEMMLKMKQLEVEAGVVMNQRIKVTASAHKDEANAILALAKARDIGDSDTVERLEMFLQALDAERQRQHEMQMQMQNQAAQAQQQALMGQQGPGGQGQ